MTLIMGILNLSPDSFWEPGRGDLSILDSEADIIDIGAVSTRPGAADVSEEEEWSRLLPVLSGLKTDKRISIDTVRSGIVRRAYDLIGPFIVNDISAGEDDPLMLETAASLRLPYIAMHKRGNPRTMDSLCNYPEGIMAELLDYFGKFSLRAEEMGIEDWILDPGLGFAKTERQCWEILENLELLKVFGRPVLVGASNKRFTRGDNRRAQELAVRHGADILRVHQIVG